jgi:CMP-N,N'-diacetyllegionaminic acid synthase
VDSVPPRILSVTLARGGSKSILKKNVTPLLGVPLIGYTVVEAKRVSFEHDYIVSTDDEEIAACARRFGAETPFLRPAELAGDQASSAAAVIHALQWMEEDRGQKYDIVVELMCTNPMKTAKDIEAVVEKMIATEADSVIGVTRLWDHHPMRVKKIEDDRLVDFCMYEKPENRRQDLDPPAYIRNGSIYAVKRDVLLATGARYGTEHSRPHVMPAEASVNIDSPIDLLLAEMLLKSSPRPYITGFSIP